MKCLVCETETSNPKYCSLQCAGVASWQGRARKDKTKQCVECGNDFQYKELSQRFCSQSCSAVSSNKTRKRVRRITKSVCRFCNTEYVAHSKDSKYCSSSCAAAQRSKVVIDEWKINPDSATTTQGLSRAVRLHLIRESDNQCSQCGWGEVNPTTGRSPLEVDHIDGNCYNNSAENLRVLCPNCHSLTPTYKALNKSSRSYRTN